MSESPYRPPQVESFQLDATPNPAKLYSPGQMAWATFLGAPVAGCLLLAFNNWRLGNQSSARVAVAFGVVSTILLLVLAFVLPEKFPNKVIPAVYTIGMFHAAKSLQGNAFESHVARGGATASTWKATGVGVMCLVGVLVVIFAAFMILPEQWIPE